MNVLIFNCGSSSQNFKVFATCEPETAQVIASGKARNVATRTQAKPQIDWQIGGLSGVRKADLSSHRLAAQEVLRLLAEHGVCVDAVGHRFVHGGEWFQAATRIDPAALERLQKCLPLAPIHNPNSYSVIEVCLQELPGTPQAAIFDTAFHAGLPEEARRYAIPRPLAEMHGFRKYGFHGLSCRYVSGKAAEMLGRPLESLRLIICHLGTGGSSVTAVRGGQSLDTSMGYSPLPGLVMSTRCGDIDAEIVLELVRKGFSAGEISHIFNNQSGLLGLSGYSSNLAEVITAAGQGNRDCQAAYQAYANRLKLYLGGYYWTLGGADALIFTDEIGVTSWKLRQEVCGGVESLGILLDEDKNQAAPAGEASWVHRPGSAVGILVTPTDEEGVILEEVCALLSAG